MVVVRRPARRNLCEELRAPGSLARRLGTRGGARKLLSWLSFVPLLRPWRYRLGPGNKPQSTRRRKLWLRLTWISRSWQRACAHWKSKVVAGKFSAVRPLVVCIFSDDRRAGTGAAPKYWASSQNELLIAMAPRNDNGPVRCYSRDLYLWTREDADVVRCYAGDPVLILSW